MNWLRDVEELIEGPIYSSYGHLLSKRTSKHFHSSTDDSNSSSRSGSNGNVNGSTVSLGSHKNEDDFRTSKSKSVAHLTEAQRDRRTVFVQQLSVRCTSNDLSEFFSSSQCPARQVRLVYDKFTRRSKGVAYVEFFEEDQVRVALKLAGKKLLGIPIVVELTETEKNRLAAEAAATATAAGNSAAPATSSTTSATATTAGLVADEFVKLYIGALHPSLSESDLEKVFEPFGILENVEILREDTSGVSKGVAFVQFKRHQAAKAALEALNGFELAGRAIRVGPVRSKPTTTTKAAAGKEGTVSSKTETTAASINADDDVYEEEEGVAVLTSQKRTELMKKLMSSRFDKRSK